MGGFVLVGHTGCEPGVDDSMGDFVLLGPTGSEPCMYRTKRGIVLLGFAVSVVRMDSS